MSVSNVANEVTEVNEVSAATEEHVVVVQEEEEGDGVEEPEAGEMATKNSENRRRSKMKPERIPN